MCWWIVFDRATIPTHGPQEKPIGRPGRNPWIWSGLISLNVVLGLGSRRCGESLPGFVADYAGDTLWALGAFLGIGLLLPRPSTWLVAALAMSFSVMIEINQLYHASWIDSIRGTTLGALVLGHGFLWSDLACYAIGIGLGVTIEVTLPCGIDSRTSSPGTSSSRSKG